MSGFEFDLSGEFQTTTPSQRDERPLAAPGGGTVLADLLERRGRDECWRERAACKGKTALFFPDGKVHVQAYDAAKQICRGCPVLTECTDWVLSAPPMVGYVAGMNERERRRFRRDAA